jgi:hypothetical protein
MKEEDKYAAQKCSRSTLGIWNVFAVLIVTEQ